METVAINANEALAASIIAAHQFVEAVKAPRFKYALECVGADGEAKWSEELHNLVTTPGGNDLLDKYFKGAAYTAAWFLSLKSSRANLVAATDTLASHGSWTEVFPQGGTNRTALVWPGSAAARSNTATLIAFAITVASTVVGGAFVASVISGTAGILYSGTDFAADRTVITGDTLNVTLTVSV